MDAELRRAFDVLTSRLNGTQAEILRENSANIDPFNIVNLKLDNLTSKENPIDEVFYDFKSFAVLDATDNDCFVYAILGRKNASKKFVTLKKNFAYERDLQTTSITFFSPAQAGKTMTVGLCKDGVIRTGAFLQSGTVTIAPPSALVPLANPVIPAATATLLVAADSSTKVVNIQNNDGASIFLGPSNVTDAGTGATRGIEVTSGGFYKHTSTSALYIYSTAGFAAGGVTVLKET